jgi:hypothetical protein
MALRGFNMKTLIAKLEALLKTNQKDMKAMDKACEKDEEIQDDTEWVNSYHNLTGFIEGLETAINEAKALDKKKKK